MILKKIFYFATKKIRFFINSSKPQKNKNFNKFKVLNLKKKIIQIKIEFFFVKKNQKNSSKTDPKKIKI